MHRHLFSLPASPIYLSGASRSPLPRSVLTVGVRALRRKEETPWSITSPGNENIEEQARVMWSKLLNTPGGANDLALAPSCSYAISVAANVLFSSGKIRPNDVILVLSDQMSSNVYPWQHLAKRTGAKLHAVKLDDFSSSSWTEAVIVEMESGRVKVVAVPNVHWCDGALLNLERIGACCRSKGAMLVVDATQSLGAFPLDVQKVQPDFLAASSHKWLMGPYGVCLLYVAAQWQQHDCAVPLEHHEHNRFGADGDVCLEMQDDLVDVNGANVSNGGGTTGYEERFKSGARKFDSGGRPNPVLLPMVVEGLRHVLAWNPEQVHISLSKMTNIIQIAAKELGLVTPKEHAGHILGISALNDPEWSDRCSSYLKSKGIIIASRFGHLRVAPHVYNTPVEISTFCSVLKEFVEQQQQHANAKL